MIIKVKPLVEAPWPLISRGSEHAVGWDVTSIEPKSVLPGETVKFRTGIAIEIPPGIECQLRPRSSLSIKENLIIPNSPGTIDPDYRGEIIVYFFNLGKDIVHIAQGQRIAQLVFNPVFVPSVEELVFVNELSETKRGEGGFGSTGK